MKTKTVRASRKRVSRRQNLGAQLEQLENAQLVLHLVEDEPAFIFKHALMQEAAYESLLKKTRRDIHFRVAQTIESLYTDRIDENVALLAEHYAQAGDDAKTMEYSVKAAEAAARHFAYPEATLQYARALDAFRRLPDTEDHRRHRVDTIAHYVELAWGATIPAQQLALLAEAETLAHSLRGPDGTRGDSRRLAQIQLMMAAMYLARNEYREVIRYAHQVLDQAKALGETSLLPTPLAQLGAVMVLQGHFVDAEPYLVQAITRVDETPDRWEWAWSVGFFAISLAMRGQVAEGLSEIQRAFTRMKATNNPSGITQCQIYFLAVCLEQGNMSRLMEESQRAIQVGSKSGQPLYVAIGFGYQALAQSRLGQHLEAQKNMAASRDASASVGGQFMMSDWLAAADAEIAYNAGKLEDALARSERAVQSAQSNDGIFAEGWVQRVWGQALAAHQPPRCDEAEIHFATSLRAFEAGEARIETARTQLAWGKMLMGRDDSVNRLRAHEMFAQAAAQFETSGLQRELNETRELMRVN